MENTTDDMAAEQKFKGWKKAVAIVGAIVLAGGATGAVVYTMMSGNEPSTSTDEKTGVVASTLSGDGETITLKEGENLINKAGIYHVTGAISNGYIRVNASDKDEVRIVLDNVSITNNSGPAIYIESNGNTYIELTGENTLNATTSESLKGAIHSKADLLISGTGSINIKSTIHGIVCKDDLQIDSGTFVISAGDDGINSNDSTKINGGTFTIKASGDGIHTDGYLEINGGKYNITAEEGLEATSIKINDGDLTISASDDGINASNKSTEYDVVIEINGGKIAITMAQGDTDAIDSNGNLYINGGTLTISAQFPFDYDGEAALKEAANVTVNGVETTKITNQFEGGQGGGMTPGEQRGGRMMR